MKVWMHGVAAAAVIGFVALVLFIASCTNIIPQKQVEVDGVPQWLDTSTDPATWTDKRYDAEGSERSPAMEHDVDMTKAKSQELVNVAGALVPSPWDYFVYLGGTALTGALTFFLRRANNKRRKERGLIEEVVASIDAAKKEGAGGETIVQMGDIKQSYAAKALVNAIQGKA